MSGKHFPEASLQPAGPEGPTSPSNFLSFKLSAVTISSYQGIAEEPESIPLGCFSIGFTKIEYSYTLQRQTVHPRPLLGGAGISS